jgi:hypothetical protein
MQRRSLLPGLILAAFLIAPRAFAGASPEDAALADSLYAEGGKLMEAGRWTEACPKIEASLKLDPGIGSSLRLAYCWEKLGRSASAWSMYNETEAMARKAGDKRADEAAKHAKQLEPLLSRIVLDVPPVNQAAGVEIRRDGKVIDAVAWTSGIPVDPGPHVVEATAPGRLAWKTTVTVEAKPGATTVRVPALADAPAEKKEAAESSANAGARSWGAQRVAGVAVAGAGVVGVIVGSVFGADAMSKMSASKVSCRPATVADLCNAAGLALRHEAGSAATASTVAFALGAGALAGGAALFFTAPAPKPSPSGAVARIGVGPGAAGAAVVIEGAW